MSTPMKKTVSPVLMLTFLALGKSTLVMAEESQDSINRIKIAMHVAGHLKSLAFTSLRHFGDESASVESQEVALGAGAEESSSQEERGAHYFDLDGSLTFEDVPHDQRNPANEANDNSQTATEPRTHNEYTVGWVCALLKEQTAATATLVEIHADLLALGSIGKYNIVIACLPKGTLGTSSAATVATQMAEYELTGSKIPGLPVKVKPFACDVIKKACILFVKPRTTARTTIPGSTLTTKTTLSTQATSVTSTSTVKPRPTCNAGTLTSPPDPGSFSCNCNFEISCDT
ncbi:hypothetical protein BKA65DRAFT_601153 [Rhexocercosporidium sp. MPI-PUGE-AT-0058]|nr:hypothetical protein BKA65DRAFT_601153 [Rhexocercosporidium sp. MPI-PUGE-AT-0058]